MGGVNPNFSHPARAGGCGPSLPAQDRTVLLAPAIAQRQRLAGLALPARRGRSAQRPRHALPAADGNSRPPGQLPFPNTSSPDVIRPLPALYLASESAPSSRTLDLGGLPAWRVPAAAPGRGKRGWGVGGATERMIFKSNVKCTFPTSTQISYLTFNILHTPPNILHTPLNILRTPFNILHALSSLPYPKFYIHSDPPILTPSHILCTLSNILCTPSNIL